MKAGKHQHIIHIWAHNWLGGAGGTYFIDMDLGEFTLSDYIKYLHQQRSSSIQIDPTLMKAGVCVPNDSSTEKRAENMWLIGCHISRGLEFMHALKHVHRDLKPNNGIPDFDANSL
jgi:serine/threonine protein kinase